MADLFCPDFTLLLLSLLVTVPPPFISYYGVDIPNGEACTFGDVGGPVYGGEERPVHLTDWDGRHGSPVRSDQAVFVECQSPKRWIWSEEGPRTRQFSKIHAERCGVQTEPGSADCTEDGGPTDVQ